MRVLIFAFIAVCSLGCGGSVCETVPGAPPCEDTQRAIAITDDVLAANGFARVGWFAKVSWVHELRLDDPAEEDGRILLGHTEPELTWDGIYSHATIATRAQPLISRTSFPHEQVHPSLLAGCLQGLICDPLSMIRGPHQGHQRPEWDTIVPAITAALAAEGL
jgi:hypothetical protein